MIERAVILDCAERAGFGGSQRANLLPRLIRFAQFIADHQRGLHAEACNTMGDAFRILGTEFSDGQMDGAYQCAEMIEHAKP